MDTMHNNYLEKILTAQVYDVAIESPLELAPLLSRRLDNRLLLKREDMQAVFSFKLRGAYNKMAHMGHEERERGVIAASAGNHAQGVALAAHRLGCTTVIVMPVTTPRIKIDAVQRLGARVILQGDSYDEAQAHAEHVATQQSLTFVHPYDDPAVIAGQGTVGMEILRQCNPPPQAIFVPVGGGGLIAGIAAYVKRLRPQIKIIGVEPVDADAMSRSLCQGQRVRLQQVGLFADGVAVKSVGVETFRLCQELVDDMVVVDTDAICAAIKDVFEDTRSILEPAGALSIAGAKAYVAREKLHDTTLVAVASGANMNFDRLRHVSERAELGEEREAILAVIIPERPGSFKSNEMAKLHMRHMVGGHAPHIEHELLYRFEFPERPGALLGFLNSLSHTWNISLFHYRNHGTDYGRVLIGIQVPPQDTTAFQDFLHRLGYVYWDENHNQAYRLFLS